MGGMLIVLAMMLVYSISEEIQKAKRTSGTSITEIAKTLFPTFHTYIVIIKIMLSNNDETKKRLLETAIEDRGNATHPEKPNNTVNKKKSKEKTREFTEELSLTICNYLKQTYNLNPIAKRVNYKYVKIEFITPYDGVCTIVIKTKMTYKRLTDTVILIESDISTSQCISSREINAKGPQCLYVAAPFDIDKSLLAKEQFRFANLANSVRHDHISKIQFIGQYKEKEFNFIRSDIDGEYIGFSLVDSGSKRIILIDTKDISTYYNAIEAVKPMSILICYGSKRQYSKGVESVIKSEIRKIYENL